MNRHTKLLIMTPLILIAGCATQSTPSSSQCLTPVNAKEAVVLNLELAHAYDLIGRQRLACQKTHTAQAIQVP